jgi:hypothetical protein
MADAERDITPAARAMQDRFMTRYILRAPRNVNTPAGGRRRAPLEDGSTRESRDGDSRR